MTTDMVSAALRYARAGLRVLPLHNVIRYDEGILCSCMNSECLSIGKHPKGDRRLTINEASVDPGVIQGWWSRWPSANIGIRTDGLAVIDIDPVHNGPKNWEAVWFGRELPLSAEVVTGSGGRHLFFRAEGIPNSIDRIARGVDVRGDGGYVVAPPSIHASGMPYCWSVAEPTLAEIQAWPTLPEWLREKCLAKSPLERGTDYSESKLFREQN